MASRGPAHGETEPGAVVSATSDSSSSGSAPIRVASVVAERVGIAADRTSRVKTGADWVSTPSGAITALMPLVAATSTARPCSTARSWPMASCWTVSPLRPNVALLVCTTSSLPPATTVSRTRSS